MGFELFALLPGGGKGGRCSGSQASRRHFQVCRSVGNGRQARQNPSLESSLVKSAALMAMNRAAPSTRLQVWAQVGRPLRLHHYH